MIRLLQREHLLNEERIELRLSCRARCCIDRFAAALAVMAGRHFPSPCRHDEDGELRLTVPPASFAEMVALSFDRIRHAGSAHRVLVTHLLPPSRT